MTTLLDLASRCEAATGADNSLDVLIEVALFVPDEEYVSIRANHAGTKVICTTPDRREATFWARDWTRHPQQTAAALRATAALNQGEQP